MKRISRRHLLRSGLGVAVLAVVPLRAVADDRLPSLPSLLRHWDTPPAVRRSCRGLPASSLEAWRAIAAPGLLIGFGLRLGLTGRSVGRAMSWAEADDPACARRLEPLAERLAGLLGSGPGADALWPELAAMAGRLDDETPTLRPALLGLFDRADACLSLWDTEVEAAFAPTDPGWTARFRAAVSEEEVRAALIRAA